MNKTPTDIKTAANDRPSGSYVYVVGISAAAAVGGFLFGFDSGVVNGTVQALAAAFGTQAAATGFAVASVLLGCALGAFGAGALANRIGRRPTMLLTAALFLVSAFISGAAGSVGVFIASRIMGGIAIGAASVLAPMYIAEVAPAHLRGRLASLQQLAIVLGLFCAFLSNDVLVQFSGRAEADFWFGAKTWRWMYWMEAVPSAAYLLGVLLIPESPRFLVISGRQKQARQIFVRIGGDADDLVLDVEKSLRGEHKLRLSDILVPGTHRIAPVVWVAMGLAALQQFVGINIIFYYGDVLWKAAGVSEQWALRINLLTGLSNILATIPAILLVDRVGRKPLLLGGSIGMALSLAAMAIVFGTAGATNWVANFSVTVSFLPLLKAIGFAGAYGLYTLAAIISVFFVWSAVRETKGKTLEEM